MNWDHEFIAAVIENPGMAARLLRGIAFLGEIGGTFADIERIEPFRIHDRAVEFRLLDRMCGAGVIRYAGTTWQPTASRDELLRLAVLADGAEAALRCHKDRNDVSLVMTFPRAHGCFMDALRDSGPYYANIAITQEAFVELARKASASMTVMTPFLDEDGVKMVQRMFLETSGPVKKTLVLRGIPKLMGQSFGPELAALGAAGVTLLDYQIPVSHDLGRYETFHSKVVLCDDSIAYIGSANLLGSSMSISFEMGVIASGKTANDLARVVNAIVSTLKKG